MVPWLDAAVNLFEYLARAQQLKAPPPRTDSSSPTTARSPGSPTFPTTGRSRRRTQAVTGAGLPLLVIEPQHPRWCRLEPDESFRAWLEEPLDEPAVTPVLRSSVPGPGSLDYLHVARKGRTIPWVSLDEAPEVQDAYDAWLPAWEAWAEQELLDRPVRDLYGELFSTYTPAAALKSWSVGCLAWTPEGHPRVRATC